MTQLDDRPTSVHDGGEWMRAMTEGDAEARNAEPKPDRVAEVSSAFGRLAGQLATGRQARREKAAARAADRVDQAQRKPRSDKPHIPADGRLALTATAGHVTFTKDSVIAWFTIAGVSHGFRPIVEIESAIASDAVAYSKLVGRRIYLRSTTRPYSVASWARDTDDDAKRAGKPIEGFSSEFLTRAQRHMQASSFSEKWVHLGVRISTFRKYPHDPARELAGLRRKIDDVGDALAVSSLRALPSTAEDMEWLIRRSVCLGVPMPRVGVVADYEAEDIDSLNAMATWTGEPMSKHITVTAKVPGAESEIAMQVEVLTLGRLSDQSIPQQEQTGWMQRTDRLGFAVEWSATIDVIPEEKTKGWLRGRLDVISDQMKHYTQEHGMDAPRSLARQNALATDIQTSLDSDHGGRAIRTSGWYRVAVAASSEKQLRERVVKLKAAYGAHAELVEVTNQYHTAREFIPGEPLATGSHRRRMSVLSLAAGIPQGTAEVGDKCGVLLGYTAGSAMRAVAWHTHWDMERRDRSGLLVLTGGLGSGKTNSLGWIVYQSVMSGVQWNVLDPSDRLGRLCDLPELKKHARYINLMRGRSGELNPYRVVADPMREHFGSAEEHARAVSDAQGTRKSLASDILYSFLSRSMREDSNTESVLIRALSEVSPVRESSPTDVLTALSRIADGEIHVDLEAVHRIRARDLVITYEGFAADPIGKLIFPPAGAAPLEDLPEDDVLLNIYTLNGMSIPSANEIAAGRVGTQARLAMSVMTLAAWLVQSRIYLGDPGRRKGLAIDEGKQISSIDAGKTLVTKTATDSRKFNVRAILCSQNVTHFDMSDDGEDSLGNLIGAAMIGHTEDDGAIRAALKALRAPVDEGYGAILRSLRPPKRRREELKRNLDGEMTTEQSSDNQPRHFIFSDGRNIERVVIEMNAHPHVKAALDSRPRSYVETEAIAA
ncbi:ATP-binding protein [Rathayibacter rathayi]|uniref:ATP-binding protein n=1 Tax=Rathayibacter rathayi TaxID=33887 RepID=UPI000CE8FEAC|nr:ATP-binding protein [Rathayibacter rathayi]PPH34152.1 hypothetical protein C5C28_10100 [Rathayibacter rathayi]